MPYGDRTGPEGKGPRTGRGLGYCGGYDSPGYTRGTPRGMGYGRGAGRGFGRGFGWNRAPVNQTTTQSTNDDSLKEEVSALKKMVEELKKKIDELK